MRFNAWNFPFWGNFCDMASVPNAPPMKAM
jgi:hypothetical protein